MNRFLYAAFFAVLPRAALADELLSESERVFMPEFEFGAMAYAHEDVGLGFVARTSIEYRPQRLNAPFLRLTYDTTSARYTQPAQDDLPRLRGTLSVHDVLLGGGYRIGSEAVQGVVGLQGGPHLYALPTLLRSDALEVSAVTRLGAAARASLGAELYLDAESAITVELLGQRMWGEAWQGRQGWAVGALLGFTASL